MLIKGHLPCDKCGSSDALAIYTDRTHCFSCKYTLPQEQTSLFTSKTKSTKEFELTDILPLDAIKWLLKSRIFEQDIKDIGIKYNARDKRVMLPLGNFSYQGRSLIPDDKIKYITYGKKTLPFFDIDDSTYVVLTEDWCSAYRIFKAGYQSLSILGTSVTPQQLLYYIDRNTHIILWLDGDKPGVMAANKLKTTLSLYFRSLRVIITPQDPKTYSDADIKHYISGDI